MIGAIMDYSSILKDLSSEEAERFTNALQRKSLFGGREIELLEKPFIPEIETSPEKSRKSRKSCLKNARVRQD